nr:MAG TPA: hypothetical protein [Caudoviricetes sp.]
MMLLLLTTHTPFHAHILQNIFFSTFLLRYFLPKSAYRLLPYSNQQMAQHTHYSPISVFFHYNLNNRNHNLCKEDCHKKSFSRCELQFYLPYTQVL